MVDRELPKTEDLQEENARLREVVKAADHVVYTLSPEQVPRWLKLPYNTELAIIKFLEAAKTYTSLKGEKDCNG